ncbi:hypothetical protein ACOI1H_20115 [Loktanella sp. DJP18]|uniref:hypothetical protein n=1 Tax=Loktanella sp. DJP18 TaxID=3409788 RepID=UPI003BB4D315
MKTGFETIGDVDLVRIEGEVDACDTGALCDLLVARARSGRSKLIVEFAEGVALARPGVRGLVVAAKLMQATRRKFAVVASPDLGDWLHRVGFVHLLAVHHSRENALAAMAGAPSRATLAGTQAANRLDAPTFDILPRTASKPV